MKWSVFRDLPIEDDIKNLIYDVSPSVSEEEEKQEEDIELDGMRWIKKKLIQRNMRKHKEDDAKTNEETDGDEKEKWKEEDKKNREDSCKKRKTS